MLMGNQRTAFSKHTSVKMAAHHIAKYIRHAPVSKPHVDPKIKWGAKFLGATMWFYIFYRVKTDMIEGHH